jgi:D-alanyl-D-alanine carboxypeptidase/D-alanyl-D-alanine-endopeptidase (penicillin-binding protein 4)
MRSLFVLFIFSVWLYALPGAINEEIRKSRIPQKDISIYIKETGKNGRVIASLNADTARTPASVIKVLSTYASVLKLGFDYRWPTKFYTTGKLKNGILHGDLLVKGFGDPTLNAEDLEEIVADISAKGIRQIRGNIVIDRSYFQVGDQDNSGFDQYTYSAYNAMPDAMMFNERVVTVCVMPKENSVIKKHADKSYKVVNQLQRVNAPCQGQYSWPRVKIDKSSVTPTVFLSGKISKQCGQRNICQVITKPYKSFYYALNDRLNKEGIEVKGGFELQKIPSNAKELFTHYSDTLEEIISKTAKESNNLYARHLMLYAGAKLYGAPATMQKGRDAIRYILDSRGALDQGVLKIDNGSGLSRTSKMTAKILAEMYDHAYDNYGQRWMDTLSIAGVDGTIKKRFRYSVVKNRAWMKTGTLKNVKNIGGYVQNRAGKLYTVVILVEGARARYYASKLQDDIITWLVKTSASSTINTSAKPVVSPSRNQVQQTKAIPSKSSTKVKTKVPVKKQNVTAKSAVMYYVQVGSFSAMPNERLLSSIKGLGLNYTIRHEGNYKVLVGGYKDEKKAREVLNNVRNRIHKGAFITKF